MRALTRRHALQLAALAPVAACGVPQPDGADPAVTPAGPWVPEGEESSARFPTGVIVGDARPDGAVASAITSEATVTFVVAQLRDDTWREVARIADVPVQTGSAQAVLEGFDADASYSVVAQSSDGALRSSVSTFRTAIAPDASRVIRFGATSCLGGNAPFPNLSHVAQRDLDFFCLLGDTIYADGIAASGIRDLYIAALGAQGLRDITARTSVVATWDDHEVDNNWSYATVGMEERVTSALVDFHAALPIEGGQGALGIYRTLKWGTAIELFVLDSRGERRDGLYLSQVQMDWFKAALSASTARFKIVLNSVPMTDLADIVGDIEAQDRWQGYPVQRSEILDYIAAEGITGLLWLSGDFHLGAIGKVDVPAGPAANQFEVLCGPTGSPINPAFGFLAPTDRIPVLIGEHNAVYFEADPDAGTVRVQVIGDDDQVIADQLLDV